jgi:hypothetical protein
VVSYSARLIYLIIPESWRLTRSPTPLFVAELADGKRVRQAIPEARGLREWP